MLHFYEKYADRVNTKYTAETDGNPLSYIFQGVRGRRGKGRKRGGIV